MIVDRHTRRQAMVRVYRAICDAERGTMNAEDLHREWRSTGLRSADLGSALREMAQRQLVISRDEGANKTYVLTEAGKAEFGATHEALWQRVGDLFTRLRLRIRRVLRVPDLHFGEAPLHDRRMISR